VFHKVPVSNARSLPTHTRREHFPLDASLLNELPFSSFPLLYSSRSGVLCPYPPDALGSVLLLRTGQGSEDGPWTHLRYRGWLLLPTQRAPSHPYPKLSDRRYSS
jgi:hypothetical protein